MTEQQQVAQKEAPKMKIVFVEDVARHICDQVPLTSDNCWTSEIIHMCILKSANIQGVNVCFKYYIDPKDESTLEVVPIYQARVYEALLKSNKTDLHSYNVFAVESGKNKNSKFVEEAKKKTSTLTLAEGEAVDKKEAQLVFATLDMTVHQFHATAERTDSLPHNVVVPGDIRLNTEKFDYKRANFYTKQSLPQNYKKQRLIEIAEYKLTLELLSKIVMTGKRLTKDEMKALQVVVGDKGEKVNVSESFADRCDGEAAVVADNVHPKNKVTYDSKFKRMWKMVADYDPTKYIKEVTIPTPASASAPAAAAAAKKQ